MAREPSAPAAHWQPSATTLAGAASQATSQPSRRRTLPLIAAGAATIALAAIVTITVLYKTRSEPVAAPAPVAAPPEPRPTLTVVTDPPGARVFLDGVPHGTAPSTKVLATGQRTTIRAEHDGFEPVTQLVTVDSGAQTIVLTLHPAAIPVDAAVHMPPDAGHPVLPKPPKSPGISQPSGSNAKGSGAFNPDEVGGD